MIIVDYTNSTVLVLMTILFIVMNIIALAKKKADYTLITVLVDVGILVFHSVNRNLLTLEALKTNITIDFIALAISLPLLLIVDEIEMRRSIIKNVFHKRYENKK